jgi:DNA replication protein DnaC
MGLVTKKVPVGHPDFGKAFPCVCQQETLEARHAAQLRALSNLDLVADKTFATFIREPFGYDSEQLAILEEAYRKAKFYADTLDGWLVFQGSYGSGKTHLAVAIAQHRLAMGEPVVFMTIPDLLDHLRATYAPSSEMAYDELFDRLRNAPLLVLDDLGTESPTPWAQEKLFQLINHRYQHRLPTTITTNADLARLDPRIRSRLMDHTLAQHINMALPDFRQMNQTPEQQPLFDAGLYNDMTFDTFEFREGTLPQDERRNLRQAVEIAWDYAQQPQGWLLFIGAHGNGKTHLAAAIANARHATGETVVLVTVPDLLDYLRAAFAPTAEGGFSKRFYDIRNTPLLILDQFDLTNASSWALEKIRQIVDYRYLKRLPTVFTTARPLENLDPMIRSRILDARRCIVHAILAPDYRGGRPTNRPPGAGGGR